jgi:hypothetical protein
MCSKIHITLFVLINVGSDSYSGVKLWPWYWGWRFLISGKRLQRIRINPVKNIKSLSLSTSCHFLGVQFITSLFEYLCRALSRQHKIKFCHTWLICPHETILQSGISLHQLLVINIQQNGCPCKTTTKVKVIHMSINYKKTVYHQSRIRQQR